MAVAALIFLSLLGIAGVFLYLQRGAIGAQIATSYLHKRGIPSTIVVERLDHKGFTGRAVLGDPADPDLSIARVEVEFEPIPLLKGGLLAPRIRAMRLVEPRLKARWDGRRLSFGSLQPLVDDFASAPGVGPGPTVVIERGAARVSTPAGELRLLGDGRLDRGRLTRLSARLLPATLRRGELRAEVDGATLQASSRGSQLLGSLHLDVRQASRPGARLQRLQAEVAGQVPYPRGPRFDGDVRLEGILAADVLAAGPQTLTRPRLAFSVAGVSAGPLDRLSLRGSGTGSLAAARWSAPNASATNVDLAARVIGLNLARDAAVRVALSMDLGGGARSLSARGVSAGPAKLNARLADIQATLSAAGGALTLVPDLSVRVARAEAAGARARDAAVELAFARTDVAWRSGRWSARGPLRAHVRAGSLVQPVLAGDLTLRTFDTALAGDAAFGSQGSRFDLRGSAASRGGALSPAAARAFAAALPIIGTDPVGGPAILGAFREARLDAPAFAIRSDGGGVRVSLLRPAQLVGAGDARAILEARADAPVAVSTDAGFGGGLTARLSGAGLPEIGADIPSYQAGQDRGGLTLTAETRLTAAFSGATLRDLKLEAPARLTRAGGVLAAALTDCARITASGFGQADEPLLTAISTRACADGAEPALSLGPRNWRFRARLEDFQADAPASEAHIADARGQLELSGADGGQPVGTGEIAAARITDAAATKRFEPLALTGRLELAQDIWTGPVQVAEAAHGRRLAIVDVTHAMTGGRGFADISAPALTFARNGLQPSDFSPLAGALASDAVGVVSFTGRAEWAPGADVASRGRLTTAGVDFRSALGRVRRATADLTFTSLAPLETAPGQAVAAEAVDWLVPLERAAGRIVLKEDRLGIEAASAQVANGRVSLDPLELLYAPNAPVSGVVRLDEIDVGALLERFNLADKLTMQARLDGVVPFALADGALRLDKGHVFATGPGRLSIKREALTGASASTPGAPAPPGGVQDIAYQALENLAFDKLEAEIASQPMGRLGILFRINGFNDPPKGGETRISLFDLLRGRAFQGPIALPKGTPVNLTLDTSLNFDELLAAYGGRARSEPVQPQPAKE